MLTLIHGDDIAASRNYYYQLKQQHPDAVILDGQQVNLTDLTQVIEGGGLFTEEKTIFIENLITKRKNSSDYKAILAYLSTPHESVKIIMWENKELEKSVVNVIKGASVKLYKLPQSLFTFLDSVKPQNGQVLVKLFHQTLSTMDEEAVFYMLVRHTRLMLGLHNDAVSRPPSPQPSPLKGEGVIIPSPLRGEGQDEGEHKQSAIEELKRMQPWQKDKLMKQSNLFPLHHLIHLFRQLYDLEKAQKTGNLPTSLRNSIDILLLGI